MGELYYQIPKKHDDNRIKAALYQSERIKLHKKDYFSIGIFGLGKIGSLAANEIIKLEFPDYGLNITSLVLFSRNLQKTMGLRNQLEDKSERNFPIIAAGTIDEILETDICVFAADSDANKEYVQHCILTKTVPQRIIMANNNHGLIKEIAPQFRDYKGLIINATNQTDIISYFFAEYSKLNPLQIAGLNHTDVLRAKAVLLETIKQFSKDKISKEDLKIFTIGSHDENMIPVISGANYHGFGIDGLGYVDFQKIIYEIRIRAGEEMAFCHDTSITTAQAIAEVVKAAITETQKVSMSCYTDFAGLDCKEIKPKKPLFIGRPVYFNDLKVSDYSAFHNDETKDKRKKWFNDLIDAEKIAFGRSGSMLENIIYSIENNRIISFSSDKAVQIQEPKIIVENEKPKPAELKTKKEIYAISGKGIYQINGIKRVFEEIDDDMRSLNFIGNFLYVGCRNEVLKINLESRKMEKLSANRDGFVNGFNSVAILGDYVYATHSEIGLARWDAKGNFRIIHQKKGYDKSRFATLIDEGILFTLQNKVMLYDKAKTNEIFECKYEISGLDYANSRVVDKMGNVYSLKNGFLFSKDSLKSKIIKGDLTKTDDDLSILKSLNNIHILYFDDMIIAGSRGGWIYRIDNLIREKHNPIKKEIADIATH